MRANSSASSVSIHFSLLHPFSRDRLCVSRDRLRFERSFLFPSHVAILDKDFARLFVKNRPGMCFVDLSSDIYDVLFVEEWLLVFFWACAAMLKFM